MFYLELFSGIEKEYLLISKHEQHSGLYRRLVERRELGSGGAKARIRPCLLEKQINVV